MILRTALLSLTAIALTALPQRAPAAFVELALVIDGSGSISGPNGSLQNPSNKTIPPDYGDFGLQLDGYRNVFENDFFTNVIGPSQFDSLVVAAYVFSGGASFTITMGQQEQTFEYPVYSFLDWTVIDSDASAAAFGAQFDPAVIPHPGGSTNTSAALDIALNGGAVGCPIPEDCFPVAPFEPPFQNLANGLLNNGFDGDRLIIDISTDGVPTEPTGNGTPNPTDDALAIAAADNARANGVTVNAIGVGGVNEAFLAALVGEDPPAAENAGFFLTVTGFEGFEETLERKIDIELELEIIPIPAALPMFMSALGLLAWMRRRAAHLSASL